MSARRTGPRNSHRVGPHLLSQESEEGGGRGGGSCETTKEDTRITHNTVVLKGVIAQRMPSLQGHAMLSGSIRRYMCR
jgi:hypothetical protein